MIKKTVTILCLIFLFSGVISTSSNQIISHSNRIDYPIPGDMNGNYLPIKEGLITIRNPYIIKDSTQLDNNIVNIIQKINIDIYLGYLEPLIAFGPRVTTSDACNQAGDFIYNEFSMMGLQVRYLEWEDYNLYGNNVEATINGYDKESDEIYVVCAHYDSVINSPGADDDGSGVAAVLTAAKLISQYSPRHTVRFVAFDGEEQGLYGSYYYVQETINNNENIVAVLNLDMIGYATEPSFEKKVRVFQDEESQWLVNYTINVSQEYEEYIDLEILPSGYSWGSDHYYFWQAGYNAIFYAEYDWNDYYHSPEDTIENMNLGYAVKNTKLITATLAQLAEVSLPDAPEKPQKPKGPMNGKPHINYSYTSNSIDPQDDKIYYLFEWGDNTDSGWIGPYTSGDIVNATHQWQEEGSYKIRVKAKDDNDHESQWSDELPVIMVKNKKNIINISKIEIREIINSLELLKKNLLRYF
jgi:hypothetical protein